MKDCIAFNVEDILIIFKLTVKFKSEYVTFDALFAITYLFGVHI